MADPNKDVNDLRRELHNQFLDDTANSGPTQFVKVETYEYD